MFYWGYPKVRKGLLFTQRSPFREKDYAKVRKGLLYTKKGNYFSEKEVDFSPVMRPAMRNGL